MSPQWDNTVINRWMHHCLSWILATGLCAMWQNHSNESQRQLVFCESGFWALQFPFYFCPHPNTYQSWELFGFWYPEDGNIPVRPFLTTNLDRVKSHDCFVTKHKGWRITYLLCSPLHLPVSRNNQWSLASHRAFNCFYKLCLASIKWWNTGDVKACSCMLSSASRYTSFLKEASSYFKHRKVLLPSRGQTLM